MPRSLNILEFLSNLHLNIRLPKGVNFMNPYQDAATWNVCRQFYGKYYSDDNPRTLILGINPGRFGGGVTGVPFTDPIKLEETCGIPNSMIKRAELSADFIYQMIAAYGGPLQFYRHYYIGAVSPLGFTLKGKNLNYYDDPELARKLVPFILDSLKKQLEFCQHDVCFCLGEGDNYRFLSRLNSMHGFFEKIVPLAHPRFIMQYRRKKLDQYIDAYLTAFRAVEH